MKLIDVLISTKIDPILPDGCPYYHSVSQQCNFSELELLGNNRRQVMFIQHWIPNYKDKRYDRWSRMGLNERG